MAITVGDVVMRMRLDAEVFEREWDKVNKKTKTGVEKMNANLKKLRRQFLVVTGVVAGLAGGAIKMATSFETSMQKIVGLVGVAQESVDEMRESVLALAGETARSPQELAEALFAVTSAGQRGDEAMATLEAAARAAAAGLGTTKDIALTVVGALQSYQAEGLTAADATDILTATVRAGNLEASELAGSLSRIIPIAQNAGVSLEELGGAVALVSGTGAATSEVITGLRAAIFQMSAPTAEAATALADAGVSADVLKETLAEDGLIAALQLVRQAAGDDDVIFRKLIGSSEAMTSATVLLGATNERLAATFGVVANFAGATDEAFAVAAETTAFQFQQALTNLKISAVELGATLLPIVRDVLEVFSDMAGMFADLNPRAQAMVITAIGLTGAMAALGLVIPPVTVAVTALATAVGALNVLMLAWVAAAVAAVALGALVGSTLSGAARAIRNVATGSKDAINPIKLMTEELDNIKDAILGTTDEMMTLAADAFPLLRKEATLIGPSLEAFEAHLKALEEQATDTNRSVESMALDSIRAGQRLAQAWRLNNRRIAESAEDMVDRQLNGFMLMAQGMGLQSDLAAALDRTRAQVFENEQARLEEAARQREEDAAERKRIAEDAFEHVANIAMARIRISQAEAEEVKRIAREEADARIDEFLRVENIMGIVRDRTTEALKTQQRERARGRLAEALTPEEAALALIDVGRLRAQVFQRDPAELRRAGGLGGFQLPPQIAALLGIQDPTTTVLGALKQLAGTGLGGITTRTADALTELARIFGRLNVGFTNPMTFSTGPFDARTQQGGGLMAGAGAGFRTANITFEVDGHVLAQVMGEELVDEIRLRQAV